MGHDEQDFMEDMCRCYRTIFGEMGRDEQGYYYLWNERLGKIHEHYDGKTRFPSLETARFVKRCTTEWPFLIIYRHWRYSDSKMEAYNRKQEHWKILSGFVGEFKEVVCPSCGRKFGTSI